METFLWFININGQVEGPFTIDELKKDMRLNPDTLVWRKGFKEWLLIRNVPELSDLFKEEIEKEEEETVDEVKKTKSTLTFDEIALNIQSEPPLFKFWLLVFLISLTYIYFYFYLYYF